MSGRETKKAATEGGGDRISGLPDEVLHRVLWLLPTREAVQTSLLACRWRHLWKSTRRLSVSRSWRSERLNKFVNRLLLIRDSVPLDECKFSFHGFPRVDGAEVDIWIRHALSLQVRVVHAHVGTNVHTTLSDQPFVSAYVTRIPELSEVMLKGGSLDFSTCIALEDLKMHACIIAVDKIFSQSLKRLRITRCNFKFGAITHISVSSLLFLGLAYCEVQTPLLESMPFLQAAFVRLGCFDEDYCAKGTNEDCRSLCENCCGACANCCDIGNSCSCVLLGGLSSVRYLTLDPSENMYTIKRDLQCCPIISKLKTLVLDNWNLNTGFQTLLCFLQHTPLLQTLIVKVPKVPRHTNAHLYELTLLNLSYMIDL
ncbi:hypothetical protein PVAP13_7NG349351 [Panicum virgatum]|uniref:F-box domain-containing protein n=1 Tax=Panicum virgatum TaxID=38727 RepID=A0A8T0PXQ8_PANVG|nr:hypothetical protein PVAP13_7NG349351 [Panicum virgatum]